MRSLIAFLKEHLLRSRWAHIREQKVSTIVDLIDLLDRFVDDKLRYELEWDDFISWTHPSTYLEEVRNRIGVGEKWLFSADMRDRHKYVSLVVRERNRAAALIGRPARLEPRPL